MVLKKENRLKMKGFHEGVVVTPDLSLDPKATWEKFFLCRTLAPPLMEGHLMMKTRFMDPEGNGNGRLTLTLPNTSSSLAQVKEGQGNMVLPKGMFLAIKNPNCSTGGHVLCDNPSEAVLLSGKDVESIMGPGFKESSSFWKRRRQASMKAQQEEAFFFDKLRKLGNNLFGTGCYSDAVRFYDLALQYASTEKERSMTLSNKAAALIRMRCHNAALEIAKLAMDLDPNNAKAVYRMGQALLRLGRFEEAVKELKTHLSTTLLKENESLSLSELLEVIMGQSNRTNTPVTPEEYIALCKYSLASFSAISPQLRGIRINRSELQSVADGLPEYVGPVEVKHCQNLEKGRGLFATADISPGQVILVSRAIIAVAQEMKGMENVKCSHGHADFTCLTREVLAVQVAHQINLDPAVGTLVYQLSAGKELGHLAEHDVSFPLVDMGRIGGVVHINTLDPKELYDYYGPFGLWFLPSFVNHSCSERNCVFEFYEDVLVVKAVEEIEKGDEILRSYPPKGLSYENRQRGLQNNYGFKCTCKLCTFDETMKNTVAGIRRRTVLNYIDKMTPCRREKMEDLGGFQPQEAASHVEFMENLWKKLQLPGLFPALKLQLIGSYFGFAGDISRLMKKGDHGQGLYKQDVRVAKLGVMMGDHGFEKISSMMNVVSCLFLVKNREGEIRQCVKAMKDELLLWFGTIQAIRLFDERFPTTLEEKAGVDFFAD